MSFYSCYGINCESLIWHIFLHLLSILCSGMVTCHQGNNSVCIPDMALPRPRTNLYLLCRILEIATSSMSSQTLYGFLYSQCISGSSFSC
jgi:hypothetical protein